MSPFRLSRRARGQTLVLLALTMLLLVLMVLLTLGMGVRVKEKMELQQVADAAAYSNAVATARTLNSIALLNRAEVSVMVALAGTQSLISFSSAYYAMLPKLLASAEAEYDSRCTSGMCTASCAQLSALIAKMSAVVNAPDRVQKWNQLDEAAGAQSKALQGVASGVRDRQTKALYRLRDELLAKQALTRAIAQEALGKDVAAGGKWRVPENADLVSLREFSVTGAKDNSSNSDDTANSSDFALNPRSASRELGVKAAMGSRGEEFVTSRAGASLSGKLQEDLGGAMAGVSIGGGSLTGSGFFSAVKARHGAIGPAPVGAIGEDHGSLSVSVTLDCALSFQASTEAWVYSSDLSLNNDAHTADGTSLDDDPAFERHTMGSCSPCPGIWTMFVDLNPDRVAPGGSESWLYGQPKNVAAIQRDYSAGKPDPWELVFGLQFSQSGGPYRFDNTGTKAAGKAMPTQAALATGLAYYHRPQHWREPPNFFNPFWRATLVSTAVNRPGDPRQTANDDMSRVLKQMPDSALLQQGVRELAENGFEGWQ